MTDDVKQFGCIICKESIPITMTHDYGYPILWACKKYKKALRRAEDGKIMPCIECEEGKE